MVLSLLLINILYLILDISVSSQTSDAGTWLSLKYLPNITFQILFYYKISPDAVSDIKMHTLLHYVFVLKIFPRLHVVNLRL